VTEGIKKAAGAGLQSPAAGLGRHEAQRVEKTMRAKRAKFFAKGAITGRQIVVPHYPECFREVIVPWRKRVRTGCGFRFP